MAEVLGVIASSLQLADVALKIGQNIYRFVDTIKSTPKRVENFRRDLDQTLSLLKNLATLLGAAKKQYQNIGDTATLVEDTLKDFERELADILVVVETVYAQSKKWRSRIRIGFKGDGEWVRINDRLNGQYHKLTAASVQLSNKLDLENGERLNEVSGDVQAISIEITQNVSGPLNIVQQDVQAIRTNGDASVLLIQESMALQMTHMQRTEQLHGQQFQRVTEIRDTIVQNQIENTQSFARIEDTCQNLSDQQLQNSQRLAAAETEIDSAKDRIDQLEDAYKNGRGVVSSDIKALVNGLISVHSQGSVIQPTSKQERIRLEAQKKKLTVLIRRILKLADDTKTVKLLKGPDADEATTTIQDLFDILQDDLATGDSLKQHISKITYQLLGTESMYMQKQHDPRIKGRLEARERAGQDMMVDMENPTIEDKESRIEFPLEDGALVISSRYQKRVAPSPFGEDDEMESSRTAIHFHPGLAPGESKKAFAAFFANTSGTFGSSTVPLLFRVYNRRCYDLSDPNSPLDLAAEGDLGRLQMLLSSGELSVYDTDQHGQSLLHITLDSLKYRNRTAKGFAPKCFAVCKFLLDQGADANIIDDRGTTPLGVLSTLIFEKKPELVDVNVTKLAFEQVLKSGIENRASPFGPEFAIASLIRSLMGGSSWFFNKLLDKLQTTEFDINSYAGCYNAAMLEFAAALTEDETALFRNYDTVANKYGGDINARTWDTKESCLHLLLRRIVLNKDDRFIKSETSWQGYKKYITKTLSKRMEKMLSLGADVFATDVLYEDIPGAVITKKVGRSVTRAMYAYELQNIWWEEISKQGFERSKIMGREAEEIGMSVEAYEKYLEALARKSFEERQEIFEARKIREEAERKIREAAEEEERRMGNRVEELDSPPRSPISAAVQVAA